MKRYDYSHYLFAICNGYYELFHILQDSNKKQIPAIKEAATILDPVHTHVFVKCMSVLCVLVLHSYVNAIPK